MSKSSIIKPERLICSFSAADSAISVIPFPTPDGSSGKVKIQGYAAKFGTLSQDLGGYRTMIAPTAFDRVLSSNPDVRMLVNHDPNLLLGRTKSGTLGLATDDVGLKFSAVPPDTELAQHHLAAIDRGDMDGCSFSCDVDDDDWDFDGPDPVRTINSVSALYDVGPVTFPAFENTSVESARFALETARARRSGVMEAAARRSRRVRYLLQLVSIGP